MVDVIDQGSGYKEEFTGFHRVWLAEALNPLKGFRRRLFDRIQSSSSFRSSPAGLCNLNQRAFVELAGKIAFGV